MIAHDTQRAQLAPIPGSAILPGQDALTRIIAGKRTWWYRIIIRATVTIAGGLGTGTIVNQGRLAALFQFIGLSENGVKVIQWDGRQMAQLSDNLYASAPNQQHLVTNADGAYTLYDEITIPLAWPLSPRPWETAFVEINPNLTTNVYLTPFAGTGTTGVTNADGFLITLLAGTAVVSALSVQVVQAFDANVADKPLFRPRMEYVQTPAITGAVVDSQFYIQCNRLLRAMSMQQVSGNIEVTDILTGHQFRTDALLIDGFNGDLVTVDEIEDQARIYGGATATSTIARAILAGGVPASYVNASQLLRTFGMQRLSQSLNLVPRTPGYAGDNFRALLTGTASATPGTSLVRFGLYELERIPGVTADTLPPGLGF